MNKKLIGILAILFIGLIAIQPAKAYVDEMVHANQRDLMSQSFTKDHAVNKYREENKYNGVINNGCLKGADESIFYKNYKTIESFGYIDGNYIQIVETSSNHYALVVVNDKIKEGQLTTVNGCETKQGDLFEGYEIIVLENNNLNNYFIK